LRPDIRPLAAQAIHTQVVEDAEQPSPEVARSIRREIAPRPGKGIVRGILGVGLIAQQAVGIGITPGQMPVIQGTERLRVTVTASLDQLVIGEVRLGCRFA
jgi:hypothetical protein